MRPSKGASFSAGCEIGDGVEIENSVIGLFELKLLRERKSRDSIIMGAAYYNSERPPLRSTQILPLGIGEGSVIEGSIVDLDCRIGKHTYRVINGRAAKLILLWTIQRVSSAMEFQS